MSQPLTKVDVLFRQRFLKAQGFYAGKLDGIWGPRTDLADAAFFAESDKLRQLKYPYAIDARSDMNIRTLHIVAQDAARNFMRAIDAMELPYIVKIINGTRTYAEQNVLYAQGRTKRGPKVTNARGGQSNHNFGIAWDVGIFQNGNYITDDDLYVDLSDRTNGAVMLLESGANWKNPDVPHYQLRTGMKINDVRELFESGNPRYIGPH